LARSHSDPRIDEDIESISEEVGEQQSYGENEKDSLDEGIVLILHGV
jgi:hypothetical protein